MESITLIKIIPLLRELKQIAFGLNYADRQFVCHTDKPLSAITAMIKERHTGVGIEAELSVMAWDGTEWLGLELIPQ